MQTLARFMDGFDFVRMKPDMSVIRGGLPDGTKAYALVEPAKQYAVYLFGGRQTDLQLQLPAGDYRMEWVNPVSGKLDSKSEFHHGGGVATLESPRYQPDIALRLVARR